MEWLIGIITVCGFITGLYTLVKISKVRGIIEWILAALCPILAIWFGSLQDDRVFGGSKWEVFLHSATVDGDLLPWILLILFLAELVCIVRTVCIIAKKH